MSGSGRGRVALVSGAASGIGQACAHRLAEDGFDIVVADIKPAERTATLVRETGRRAEALQCDVTVPEEVARLVAELELRLGRCDVLVNCAGMYSMVPFEELSFEVWRRYMALNLDAMFLLCRALLPAMRKRGWGRVINIASNSFHLAPAGLTHYIASKGAVIGLTRGLASEYGDSGITVNALAPGPTLTEKLAETFFEQSGTREESALRDFMAALARNQAIKRIATPRDLVGVVSFLASDDAAFVTGQTLLVDGGWAHS